MLTENLLKSLIINPYNNGKRRLKVISGYSSPTFVHHLLYSLDEIEIDLIIGMTNIEPITIWEHKEYLRMIADTNRLKVKYYNGEKPLHSKIIYWEKEGLFDSPLAFMGSANFTRNGYVNFQETMTELDPIKAIKAFQINNLIDCTANSVEQLLNFTYQYGKTSEINTSALASFVRSNKPKVDLLLTKSNKPSEIQNTAGLNWGQREGRELNQAYIPVTIKVHNENPGFFPEKQEEFSLITDDGESFICVMAQANRKAIETSRDNSILGKYFRKRLNVPFGEFVTVEHLERYGRNFVSIYKIDEYTFYLDFS